MRTLSLVSLGSAGFALTLMQGLDVVPVPDDAVEYDPTGIVAAIATGIGFLGAGAIFRSDEGVEGLTTGAGIWLAGAIGLACAVGQIVLAAMLALAGLAILAGLRRLERWIG